MLTTGRYHVGKLMKIDLVDIFTFMIEAHSRLSDKSPFQSFYHKIVLTLLKILTVYWVRDLGMTF